MLALSSALVVVLSLPAAAPADELPDAKTELAKWQGTWEIELQIFGGKEKMERSISKVVVKGDVMEVYHKGIDEPVKGTIKIVLDGKVKGLDLTIGKNVVKAAYFIDGDRALLAVGDLDSDRPKDFSTSIGTHTGGIMVYKRVQK